jgi:hypothetical protein
VGGCESDRAPEIFFDARSKPNVIDLKPIKKGGGVFCRQKKVFFFLLKKAKA